MKKLFLFITLSIFLLGTKNGITQTPEDYSQLEEVGLSKKEVDFIISAYKLYQNHFQAYQQLLSPLNIICSEDPIDITHYPPRLALGAFLSILPKISTAEEEVLGDQFHQSNLKRWKVINSDPRRIRLQNIMNKLLVHTNTRGIKYDIHLINSIEINAFATLGGHLYVTTGLLYFTNSEDELAMIIGHEIAHVEKKHVLQKVQFMKFLTNKLGNKIGSKLGASLLAIMAPFGRIDEYESDKVGGCIVKKAGYNISIAKQFFTRLKQNEKYNLTENLFRTHPYSNMREKCLHENTKHCY